MQQPPESDAMDDTDSNCVCHQTLSRDTWLQHVNNINNNNNNTNTNNTNNITINREHGEEEEEEEEGNVRAWDMTRLEPFKLVQAGDEQQQRGAVHFPPLFL